MENNLENDAKEQGSEGVGRLRYASPEMVSAIQNDLIAGGCLLKIMADIAKVGDYREVVKKDVSQGQFEKSVRNVAKLLNAMANTPGLPQVVGTFIDGFLDNIEEKKKLGESQPELEFNGKE